MVDYLSPGEVLRPGDELLSNNRKYALRLAKGELSLFDEGLRYWSTGTRKLPASDHPVILSMQADDGHLVLYTADGRQAWATGVRGSQYAGSRLVLQDDRNLVVYTPDDQPIWATDTMKDPPTPPIPSHLFTAFQKRPLTPRKPSYSLQVHLSKRDRLKVQIQDWASRERPTGLRLSVFDETMTPIIRRPLDYEKWHKIGGPYGDRHAPTLWVLSYQLPYLPRAGSGRDPHRYVATLDRGGEVLSSARFPSLQLYLPLSDQDPFVVFAGSCFDSGEDRYRFSRSQFAEATMAAAQQSAKFRPSVCALLGDQVYVDAPWGDFQWRRSTVWLRKRWHGKYRDSWARLEALMAESVTVCSSDDHEYWNDYPNKPVVVWRAINAYPKYRRDIAKLAEAYVDRVQGVEPLRRYYTKGLELLFLETRRYRLPKSRQFTSPVALNELSNRIRNLRNPAVLFIGQPIFAPALSKRLGGLVVGDRNLPSHRAQYRQLIDALASAPHDILVVAGDPHFSRVAVARFGSVRSSGGQTRVIEVTASPLSGLRSAPSRWHLGADRAPASVTARRDDGEVRGAVSYLRASSGVPLTAREQHRYLEDVDRQLTQVNPREFDESDLVDLRQVLVGRSPARSVDSGVYLAFRSADGRKRSKVHAEICSLDLNATARSGRPVVDFEFETVLQ